MHLELVLVAKNILAKLCCFRVSHLKPLPSGAGQKGSNSLGMACLKRVESFLIIENKKKEASSHHMEMFINLNVIM